MIRNIHATQRLDSQGDPTVQVDLTTDRGTFRALVPAGTSAGGYQPYEAHEIRDGDNNFYNGMGVQTAVDNVHRRIAPALIEKQFDPETQLEEIDDFLSSLDGTPNCTKLGANALLGVSMACARAGAAAAELPLYDFIRREADMQDQDYILPVPFLSALNGGVRSGDCMAFQDIMVAPVGATSFAEAMCIGSEIHHRLRDVVHKNFDIHDVGFGDEGGFSAPLHTPEQGLQFIQDAIVHCELGDKTKLAIHAASPDFYVADQGVYDLGFPDKATKLLSPEEMLSLYTRFIEDYPIVLLEDPFDNSDWHSWTELTKSSGIEIVGDTLLCTNTDRIHIANDKQACNSVLLKINQIGTVTKAIKVAKLAYSLGWSVFVSHRAGEPIDDFIADLSVAVRAGHLKAGAPWGGERVAKYNRLLEIEEELKAKKLPCFYAGQNFRHSGRASSRWRKKSSV